MARPRSSPSAFERLRFGATRTLNLREGLPSAADAALRLEQWLRTKQLEQPGEVLVITGRGAHSDGGIPVVRETVVRVLRALRRKGVVAQSREQGPGAFIVTLAPLRALLDAPARHRVSVRPPPPRQVVRGLAPATDALLRRLAITALDSLGVVRPDASLVEAEMQRQFSLLAAALPPGQSPDEWLTAAITRALDEYDAS
ncbi:MAG TPA: Smr/MutS family protein [Gemmatimonadaceae bacterium]